MPPRSPPHWASLTAWFENTWCGRCFTAGNTWTSIAMTDRNPPLPRDIERDPVHQTAAEWLVRLQNTQVSVDDVLAWQSWIHESPRHAEAFARLEETSQALRSLASLAGAPGCDVSNDGYDGSVPLKDYLALDRPHGVVKEAPRSSRLSWFALAATLVAVAIASVLWSTSSASLYYTAVGENRRGSAPQYG